MIKVEDKLVCFSIKNKDFVTAYEDDVPEGKFKVFSLIKALLFKRGFAWKLEETLKYALRHSDCYRGSGSAAVLLFSKESHKLWNEK